MAQLFRGGGQVVSMLAFSSDNPSSNTAAVYGFYALFEKNKDKRKSQGWPI